MKGYFTSNELEKIHVRGTGETIFYVRDDDDDNRDEALHGEHVGLTGEGRLGGNGGKLRREWPLIQLVEWTISAPARRVYRRMSLDGGGIGLSGSGPMRIGYGWSWLYRSAACGEQGQETG